MNCVKLCYCNTLRDPELLQLSHMSYSIDIISLLVRIQLKNQIKVEFQKLVEAFIQSQVIYRLLQQQQLLGRLTKLNSNFFFTSIFVNLGHKNLIFELNLNKVCEQL
ncbi:Hypothetical_protein [Hexamita inflata]|uniref:Hypothetical_protein n=1 Tax=Hexamita inflata TaxID=28002 RepID=A0ABP1H768_9EUKA